MLNTIFTRVTDKTTSRISRWSMVLALSVLSTFTAPVYSASKATNNTLSLQNLERERAALIQDMLSPALNIEQRQQQLAKRQRQLTDMERMVMRDERLLSSTSSLVTNAFSSYELTFLVHAGAERKQSAAQHWLTVMNITGDAVLDSHVGFRK